MTKAEVSWHIRKTAGALAACVLCLLSAAGTWPVGRMETGPAAVLPRQGIVGLPLGTVQRLDGCCPADSVSAFAFREFLQDGRRALRADNPGQGLRLQLDGNSVLVSEARGRWSIRLWLDAPSSPENAATLLADDQRAAAVLPGATEIWDNLPHGLVRTVTLYEPPAGEGESGRVRLPLATSGIAVLGQDDSSVTLCDAPGRPVLRMTHLYAEDASGCVLDAAIEADGEGQPVLAIGMEGAELPVQVVQGVVLAAAPAKTVEDRVVELTNRERRDNGDLPPLKRVTLLDTSSDRHCHDMATAGFFEHQSLDNNAWAGLLYYFSGEMPWDRMTDVGYTWNAAAENLAAGYDTPENVVAAWMASAGHRANILSEAVREIGTAYFEDPASDFITYWGQNFGRRANVYPVIIDRENYRTTSRNVSLYVYGTGWADQMRFRNEDGSWSAWQDFSTSKSWRLSSGDGLKTVYCQLQDDLANVAESYDTIVLEEAESSSSGGGGGGGGGGCAIDGGAGKGSDAVSWVLPWLFALAVWAAARMTEPGRVISAGTDGHKGPFA
jgi:uncharacterized protein YkwD